MVECNVDPHQDLYNILLGSDQVVNVSGSWPWQRWEPAHLQSPWHSSVKLQVMPQGFPLAGQSFAGPTWALSRSTSLGRAKKPVDIDFWPSMGRVLSSYIFTWILLKVKPKVNEISMLVLLLRFFPSCKSTMLTFAVYLCSFHKSWSIADYVLMSDHSSLGVS